MQHDLLKTVLSHITNEPAVVQAGAAELRKLIKDPGYRVESLGEGVSKVYRSAPVADAGRDRDPSQFIFADVGVRMPAKAGKSEIRLQLEALPVDPERSVFVAYRSSGSLHTILAAIRRTRGFVYRTHMTVRDGVQGTRLWRTS